MKRVFNKSNAWFFVVDLYEKCGDHMRENEAYQMHCNFSQILLKDQFQARQMPEHNLIQWTQGNFPMLTSTPSTSGMIMWTCVINKTETNKKQEPMIVPSKNKYNYLHYNNDEHFTSDSTLSNNSNT